MESTPAAYAASYRAAYTEAAALATPLSPSQFNWKPAPDVWSVAECLVHLNTANAKYLPTLERAVASGGPQGEPPFRYGGVARWFIASTGPQGRRKLPAPAGIRPTPATHYDADRVLADFRALMTGLDEAISRAAQARLDLARVRIASPILPLLRLPAGAFFESIAGHAQRHLTQARRVTERPDFPR